jgi:hypothetical protein
MQLLTGAELFGNVIFRYSELTSQYNCSARDWDGKDYLRIIPRVVW